MGPACAHAQQRAKERYAANLLPEEVERMAVEIEHGRATYVRPAMAGRSVYLVHCPKANRHIPVIWDPNANGSRIVTVLPDSSWQFGTAEPKPKGPKFREIDPDDLPAEDPPEVDQEAMARLARPAPNNALAEALEEALKQAGWPLPFASSSPSEG